VIGALVLTFALANGPGTDDEKAIRIADEMLEALGGKEAWERARVIRFTFVRQGRKIDITWDRYDGRYRLEATNDTGVPYVVVMNLLTRQGKAAMEGRLLGDKELSEYLTRAARIWAGETYWLLAPYKLRDPGAVLSYDGEEALGGTTLDRIHVKFDRVGFTPGDEFWLYVNRKTRLLDRWKFKLESGAEGDYRWSGWERFGGILLATERYGANGEQILFENVAVTESIDDAVFSSLGPTR
jgi:hypothetical protein